MLANGNCFYQRQLPGFPQNFAPVFVLPASPLDLVPQYDATPVQNPAPQDGMSFGTFLAIGTTALSAAVMLNPRSSKEAKAIAQVALGVSLPFVLNKAFELQPWPDQQLN